MGKLYIHSMVYVPDDYVEEEEGETPKERTQDERKVFSCAGCGREVPWKFGAADDMPDHCDDCWNAEHYPKETYPLTDEVYHF